MLSDNLFGSDWSIRTMLELTAPVYFPGTPKASVLSQIFVLRPLSDKNISHVTKRTSVMKTNVRLARQLNVHTIALLV